MQKLIVLQKQLNNCEWEIELSSYKVADIDKAKSKLKKQGIKYKTSTYEEVANKHPYKIKFIEINSVETRISISSNILNCLENDKITDEEIIIRKSKESFTVYLSEVNEAKALVKGEKLYRLHKEHILR